MKRTGFSAAILNRKYTVDKQPTILRDFLNVNFYTRDIKHRNVNKITYKDVRAVVDLEPGQTTFIESVEVTRIS